VRRSTRGFKIPRLDWPKLSMALETLFDGCPTISEYIVRRRPLPDQIIEFKVLCIPYLQSIFH
jgi:hypothetical protein